MRRRRRRAAGCGALLGFVVSALACGDDGGSAFGSRAGASDEGAGAPAHTVRDSAGIRIVNSERPVREGSWTIEASALVTIGQVEGSPEYQLWNANQATRLSDGRIVIVNSGSKEIRWYSPRGEFLGSAGGEGEGPGEFTGDALGLVEVGSDSVVVSDYQQRRLSFFGPDMRFHRVISMGRIETGLAAEAQADLTPVARFRNDRYLLHDRGRILDPRGRTSVAVERSPLRTYDWAEGDRRAELLVELPGLEEVVGPADLSSAEAMLGSMPVTRTFARNTSLDADADRWVTAENARAELQFRDPSGAVAILARWRARAEEVTPADLEAARESDRRRSRRAWDPSEIEPHETMPFFAGLFLDRAGHVWVREYEGPNAEGAIRYMIFDADGVWIDTVSVSSRLSLLSVGADWILARSRSDLGVEGVSLHRLEKR